MPTVNYRGNEQIRSYTSLVDYCGRMLVRAPKNTTDKLQWVLTVAARLALNTQVGQWTNTVTH